MIIGFDRNPRATIDQKVQSLMESVQMALNEQDLKLSNLTKSFKETVAEIKESITQITTALQAVQIDTASVTDTTQSGWILLKYKGSNISASQYDVISAGCDGSGRLIIPFVSGGIWYAEIATYSGGTLRSIADTTVTVSYTLRKR